ncbi:MAG: outer membrane protein [Francisellaceae bacterium]|jgi:outer membrane protein
MKKIIMVAIITCGLFSSVVFAENMKIGIVDYMRIYTEAPQGQKTLEALKSKLLPQVEQFKKQQKDLMTEMQDLEKNKQTLTKNEYVKQRSVLETKGKTFQAQVQGLRQQEEQQEQKLAQDFQQTLNSSIQLVGKKGKYDLILNAQAAPYSSTSYNVTDEVLQLMMPTGN